MIRSDLWDYSDAYIVVKRTLDPLAANENKNDKAEKNVAFKSNASFRSCISKINSTFIDNAEDLDIVMPMHKFLEYSQNYYMTSGSLWNYYRGEMVDVNDNASDDKSFKYQTKIVGKHQHSHWRNEGDSSQPEVPT